MKKSEKQKFDNIIDFKEIAKKIREVSKTMEAISKLMENNNATMVEIKNDTIETEPVIKEKTVKLPNGKTKKVTFISDGEETQNSSKQVKREIRPRKTVNTNLKDFKYHDSVPEGVIIK